MQTAATIAATKADIPRPSRVLLTVKQLAAQHSTRRSLPESIARTQPGVANATRRLLIL
jgi:hypothetical protein